MKKNMNITKRTFTTILGAITLASLMPFCVYANENEKAYEHSFGTIDTGYEVPGSENSETLSSDTEIPSSYNAVDRGYVTSVKDQGEEGTCWVHGTLASLESNIIKKAIDDNPDLSERHLAFYCYNYKDLNDPKKNTLGDYAEKKGSSGSELSGGSVFWVTNALANWVGAANEDSYPYSNKLTVSSKSESSCFDDIVHVQNIRFIPEDQPDIIKWAIMEYGSLSADYYHDDYDANLNKTYSAYYNNSVSSINHTINVIGWDDNFSASKFNVQPQNNGAWLVKNSWGTDILDEGLMWISYEDISLKNFVAFDGEAADNYDNNYFYDGGICDNYISCNMSSLGDSTTEYANVYTSGESRELLKAVSFVIGSADVDYSIQIYLNPETGNPSSGQPLLSNPITGTTDCAGYYTVTLDEAVTIPKNAGFAVVISVPGNTKIGYDASVEWDSSDICFVTEEKENQSFYGSDSLENSWVDEKTEGRTFRIHAFTDNLSGEEPQQERIDLSGAEVKLGSNSEIFTGRELQPLVSNVVLDYNGSRRALVKDRDYTVDYENNVDVGSVQSDNPPTVIISGINEYEGEVRTNFSITPMRMSKALVEYNQNGYTYLGGELEIEPVYRNPNTNAILKKGVDYTLTYRNNVDVADASGTYAPTVIATGIGNYYETKTSKFSIITCPINSQNIVISFTEGDVYGYTGYAIEPELEISNNGNLLEKNKDYKVKYSHNISINDAQPRAEITGIGNYKGTTTKYFSITSGDFSKLTMSLDKDSYEYTGQSIKPNVTITNEKGEKVNGALYNVEYSGNIYVADKSDANPPTVTAVARNGQGYEGSISKTFSITKRDLSSAALTLDKQEYYCTGNGIEPQTIVKLTANGEPLLAGADYEVIYENNVEPGLAKGANPPRVVVNGIGNYRGTISKAFDIKAELKKNNNAFVSFDKGDIFIWTGSEIRPNFKLTYNNGGSVKELTKNVDYTVTYSNNVGISTDANKAYAEITGKGLYAGSVIAEYSIVRRNLLGTDWKDAVVTLDKYSYTYNGEEKKPRVTVKFNGEVLKAGTDYRLEYCNNTNAGKTGEENSPKAVVTGIGNYSGVIEKEFEIIGVNISRAQIKLEYTSIGNISYDDLIEGKIIPKVTVIDTYNKRYAGRKYVLDGECYSVEIADNGNRTVGNVTLIIKGKGNYSGEKKAYYTIVGTDISKVGFAAIGPVTASVNEYGNMISVEPEVIALAGKNYITPELDSDNGFEVYYSNNSSIGKGQVLIVGRGSYSGSKTVPFLINGKPISSGDIIVSLGADKLVYNGQAQKLPDLSVTDSESGYVLKEGRDFSVKYSKNTNAGLMKVSIFGKGIFTGNRVETIQIVKAPIDNDHVALSINDAAYNAGKELKPAVTAYYTFDSGKSVKLAASDFHINYSNNINISTNDNPARVIITGTGKGNYDTGACDSGSFMIKDKMHMLSSATVLVSKIPDYVYTGSEIEPEVSVTLKGDKSLLEPLMDDRSNKNTADYCVSYANNINKGRGYVYIKGMNEYAGQVQTSFMIANKSIACSQDVPDFIEVEINNKEPVYYTGYACKPELIITDTSACSGNGRTLILGQDYSVVYGKNTEASSGIAYAAVSGRGNYRGGFIVRFSIMPINFDEEHIIVNTYAVNYSGKALKPLFDVYYSADGSGEIENALLLKRTVYSLTYGNNINASDDASVTVTRRVRDVNVTDPAKKYVNSKFSIEKGNISNAAVSAISNQKYRNGSEVKPVPSVRVNGAILKAGRDFTLSYSDNIRRGLASVTISAAPSNSNYEGSKTVYFYIK